jgi:hypothetical protein
VAAFYPVLAARIASQPDGARNSLQSLNFSRFCHFLAAARQTGAAIVLAARPRRKRSIFTRFLVKTAA